MRATAMTKSTYPEWVHDQSPIADPFKYGERAVKWLKSLKHPKNPLPGHSFKLDPWQERTVRRIYGPRHPDGTRIIRNAVLLVPRGARKTSLGAALALLHTAGPEQVHGGQVICAAVDRNQAKLAYDEAQMIAQASPKLDDKLQVAPYRYFIKNHATGTIYTAVSSDGGAQHGRTPTFALVDELHAWPKRDLWDAIRSGMVKSPGSLMLITTTAGRGQENLSSGIIEYARGVAKGEIDDDACLPILFETDPDADWKDEKVWARVNPGLQYGYPDISGLRQLAREALKRPGDREAFRQFNLNVWLDHSFSPFVEMNVYDAGNQPIDMEALEGEPCWLGVDLSSNSDLTVVVAAFRDGDDGYVVIPWFFCPKDNLFDRQEKSGLPYVEWADKEYLEPTAGNVVDFRIVEDRIREICTRYNVREIAFDPHLARNTLNNLLEDGYPCVEFRQGWVSMAPAIKELERSIVAKRFRHGGHPILRQHFDSIQAETDKAGNVSFHKGKAKGKIDGAVAAAMAVARASAGSDGNSVYDTDERASGLQVW
jgi:phage terminase large subunit-like protein